MKNTMTAKKVADSVKWLKKTEGGCSHFDLERIGIMDMSVVIGWHKVDIDDGPGESVTVGTATYETFKSHTEWRIHWKIGMQKYYNIMQCDFDIDFDMPWYEDTGDVYDTCEEIEDGADFKRVAADMNKAAKEVCEWYRKHRREHHPEEFDDEAYAA